MTWWSVWLMVPSWQNLVVQFRDIAHCCVAKRSTICRIGARWTLEDRDELWGRVGGTGTPVYPWWDIWKILYIFFSTFRPLTNSTYDQPVDPEPCHNSRTTSTCIFVCANVTVVWLVLWGLGLCCMFCIEVFGHCIYFMFVYLFFTSCELLPVFDIFVLFYEDSVCA